MQDTQIAIDKSLKDLLSAVTVTLNDMAAKGLKSGDLILETSDDRVHFEAPSAIIVHRRFAGFRWRLAVDVNQLGDIATGAIREIPMTRLGAVESPAPEMSESAIGRLLGSLGFNPPDDEGEAEAAHPEAESDRGPQLTGLEDGLEEEADFGSVSEMDLDDFLAAYEAATKPAKSTTSKTKTAERPLSSARPAQSETPPERPPEAPVEPDVHPDILPELAALDADAPPTSPPKAEPTPVSPTHEDAGAETDTSGGDDPLSRLFADLGNLAGTENSIDDSVEPGTSAEDVASARGFLDLLVNSDKMEVLPDANMDVLAEGLSPILAMEERHRVKAEAVLDWLLDQDDVEDVYASDDELVALVRAW
ncbi:MAG: hypothetical protein VX589_10275 [Myxococcota bacterium]|nr:hypothetical protein [Myxococcota bacterium]